MPLDVTEATFERDVIDRSERVPVVVDFWAAWCGPCRTLGPVLERLEAEANGAWELVKVDVDTNQRLAASFGIQGIPAVHAFRGRQRVAEFVGAQPEQFVRTWVAGLGPTETDLLMEQARAAADRGDVGQAIETYRRVLSLEPARTEARTALERLELAQRAGTADEAALRARLGADPLDLDARAALADLSFSRGDVEGGARLLLEAVAREAGERRERARAHLVRLLDTLPVEDPRALTIRRELAAALY